MFPWKRTHHKHSNQFVWIKTNKRCSWDLALYIAFKVELLCTVSADRNRDISYPISSTTQYGTILQSSLTALAFLSQSSSMAIGNPALFVISFHLKTHHSNLFYKLFCSRYCFSILHHITGTIQVPKRMGTNLINLSKWFRNVIGFSILLL